MGSAASHQTVGSDWSNWSGQTQSNCSNLVKPTDNHTKLDNHTKITHVRTVRSDWSNWSNQTWSNGSMRQTTRVN